MKMKTVGAMSPFVLKAKQTTDGDMFYWLEIESKDIKVQIDSGSAKIQIPVCDLHRLGSFLCEGAIRAEVDTITATDGLTRESIEDFYANKPEWGIKWNLPFNKPESD